MTTAITVLAGMSCLLLALVSGAVILVVVAIHRLERFLKAHKNVLSTATLITEIGGLIAALVFGVRAKK